LKNSVDNVSDGSNIHMRYLCSSWHEGTSV